MSLFNSILSAIDNPELQANSNQLGSIFNTVQQLSQSSNANPETVQSAMAIVGKHVRSSLQEKRNAQGEQQAQAIVNQFSGTQPSNQAVQMLFSAPQIQQIVKEVERVTGLNSGTIQSLLPMLVPLVLNFLQSGARKQNSQGSNPVLNNFLDSDGDGDVDLMDAMKMASKYLNR